MPKNRIFYLDVLRVIACLSIIMIHTTGGYTGKDIGSLNFWIADLFNSISRIGVPLFVMISGALMLDKNYSFSKQKLIKHILRMALFLVVWSLVYFLIFSVADPIFLKHESVDFIKVAPLLLAGHYHLWFVYLIIGLYIILPLLRLWVNNENKKYAEYFILLAMIFTFIIPQIISVGSNYNTFFEKVNSTALNHLQLKYIGGFTAYYILGWYLNNYEIRHKRVVYLLGVLGLFITLTGTYLLSVTTGKSIQMYDNLSINVFLQSVSIFIILKDKFINTQSNNKVISSVSNKSLGIYAVHFLILTVIFRVADIIHISGNAIITIPFVFVSTFLLSYLASFILSKIPLLKKIV